MTSAENKVLTDKNNKNTLILIKADSATFDAMVRVFSINFPDIRKPLPSEEVLSTVLSLVAKNSNLNFQELLIESEHQIFFNEDSTLAKLITGEEVPFPDITHVESFNKLDSDFKLVDAWLLAREKLNNKLIAEKVIKVTDDLRDLYRSMYELNCLIYKITILIDFWKKHQDSIKQKLQSK